MFKRIFAVLVIYLAVISLVVPQVPWVGKVVGVELAYAKQKKKRKTLFDIIFKRSKEKRNRKKAKAVRTKRTKRSTKRNVRTTRQNRQTRNASRTARVIQQQPRRVKRAAPKKVIVVKNENAAKILVVGDFMGNAVGKGLEQLYADNPDIAIVRETKANSGIVRDDVVDWSVRVGELVDEVKPVVVVNLSGMNDRQQMRLSTGRVEKLSDAWLAEYNARSYKLASSVTSRNLPFVWVGLPPVRSGAMNADYLEFNKVYLNNTRSAGGIFVDVWDGFTNAEGKFVSAGPDINGRIVRLRGGKGINMTRAGMSKLAFFVDKALKRMGVIGDLSTAKYASLGTINLGAAQPAAPEYDPASSGKTIIIPLGSPVSDGGDVLEGDIASVKSSENTKSVSYTLVEKGIAYKPKPGRVDADWGLPEPDKTALKQSTEKTGAANSAN